MDETVMLQHLLEGLPIVVSDRATSSAEAREYLRCASAAVCCCFANINGQANLKLRHDLSRSAGVPQVHLQLLVLCFH